MGLNRLTTRVNTTPPLRPPPTPGDPSTCYCTYPFISPVNDASEFVLELQASMNPRSRNLLTTITLEYSGGDRILDFEIDNSITA